MVFRRLSYRVLSIVVVVVFYLSINNLQRTYRSISTIEFDGIESYLDLTKSVAVVFSIETVSDGIRRDAPKHDINDDGISEMTYFDLREKIESLTRNQTWNFQTSYEQSTVVGGNDNMREEGSPFAPTTKLVCRKTCCVERVWISLNQDENKLLNWRNDMQELADVMIQQYPNDEASLHATNLHSEDLIPCFVPNTIISVDNFDKSIQYFWQQVRPRIRVPFLLMTGGSDDDSPFFHKKRHPTIPEYIADPLLLKWYGTNPRTNHFKRTGRNYRGLQRFHKYKEKKFRPMLSGLSYLHPQERFLSAYLGLTNYTNPFSKNLMKKRFATSSQLTENIIDFDQDVFVHFGKKGNPFRKHLWNILCPNTTADTTSCSVDTNHKSLHEIYTDMTIKRDGVGRQYKFGISPPGMGYDCYRHYEMWYLGMIPVVWDRDPESYDLYKNLPVLQLTEKQKDRLQSRQDFVDVIEEYIQSPAFHDSMSNGTFEQGWNKLFLRSKRRAILNDTDRRILVDDKSGTEYYPAFRYFLREDVTVEGSTVTATHAFANTIDRSIYCNAVDENCAIRDGDGADRTVEWVDDPNHKYNAMDQEWINEWESASAV